MEDVENIYKIFVQGEWFFYCALACLEEKTRSKILNIPDLVQMMSCIRGIIFQTPLQLDLLGGLHHSCEGSLDGKKGCCL